MDNPSDIQALFHELESLSCDEDSGAEQDTMSISSTPKPSLRPFFSSSKSLLDSTNIPYIEADKVNNLTIYRVSFGRYLVRGFRKLANLQCRLNGENITVSRSVGTV